MIRRTFATAWGVLRTLAGLAGRYVPEVSPLHSDAHTRARWAEMVEGATVARPTPDQDPTAERVA